MHCMHSQVTRELKKQDNNVFNCVHSCLADRTFVEEICSLYKGVPGERACPVHAMRSIAHLFA